MDVGVNGMWNMLEEKPGMSANISMLPIWVNGALLETAICGGETRRISGLDRVWRDISATSSVLYNRS